MAGRLGILFLACGGVAPIAAFAQKPPSIQSRETRIALLSLFDQMGTGLGTPNDATRSRSNRRGPDVGYVSSDPICLPCIIWALNPPVQQPQHQADSSAAPQPVTVEEIFAAEELQITKPLEPNPTPVLIELAPLAAQEEKFWGDPEKVAHVAPEAPIQTPGPLPILGLGTAFGFSRRLRQRLKCARRQGLR